MSRPNSRRNLDIAIERIADEGDAVRLRRSMANAIVAQMLPEGAVKGGSALKLRFGSSATRFSKDLDAARLADIKQYAKALANSLEVGWNGFTG
ncbi:MULTISPECIES: nucleotidyl transferase AbiEii/AbiGii toxin family protein [unclassified Adlercreutzia]|uniref:nucleotidyl transferase AbiEii/AbiGii toxin family protein n=1 Tax=unclassified Adlercreutzia TaxID=2636013 RepID=UPI001F156532|nr:MULTISPECIES: nucleotidyl transferase AbiEii/AbiGii toxin family protein [unclassified Adlercreutzia]